MQMGVVVSLIIFAVVGFVRCTKVSEYSSPFCSLVLDKENYNRRELNPRNCQLLHYRVSDVVTCVDILQQNVTRSFPSVKKQQLHFAFVGDSRIRQQFFTLIEKFPSYDLTWKGETYNREQKTHSNMNASSALLSTLISFKWRPKIDQDFVTEFESFLSDDRAGEPKPHFILTGGVGIHHYIRLKGLMNDRFNYTRQLKKLKPVLQTLTRSIAVVWMDQIPVLGREDLTKEAHVYNRMARELLKGSGVVFWDSVLTAADDYFRSCFMLLREDDYDYQKCTDPLHFGFAFESHHTDTLLNYLCNKVLPRRHLRDRENICCSSSTSDIFV